MTSPDQPSNTNPPVNPEAAGSFVAPSAPQDFPSPEPTPAPQPQFGAYGVPPAGTAQPSTPGEIPAPTYGAPSAMNSQGPASGAWGPEAQFSTAAPGFSLAPKPGIIPLRPLSVGEVISGAFEALRANPKAMFVPSLIVMAVTGLISALFSYTLTSSLEQFSSNLATDSVTLSTTSLLDSGTSSAANLAFEGIALLVTSLATTVLSGLLIVAVSRSVLGRIASPSDVWQRTKGKILPLIGQSILISLINYALIITVSVIAAIALIGVFASSDFGDSSPNVATLIWVILAVLVLVVLAAILGAFFWVRFSMAPAALVLENTGVIAGMRRSWHLTRSNFWRVFGTLLLMLLIVSTATGVLSLGLGLTGGAVGFVFPGHMALTQAVTVLLTSIVSAFVIPFSSAVIALTYIDLRMRREGLDVELRRAAAA